MPRWSSRASEVSLVLCSLSAPPPNLIAHIQMNRPCHPSTTLFMACCPCPNYPPPRTYVRRLTSTLLFLVLLAQVEAAEQARITWASGSSASALLSRLSIWVSKAGRASAVPNRKWRSDDWSLLPLSARHRHRKTRGKRASKVWISPKRLQ